jgi:hypothetical protein
MVPTAYLREQAEKCRRLARDVSEAATRGRLEVLAGEYAFRIATESVPF